MSSPFCSRTACSSSLRRRPKRRNCESMTAAVDDHRGTAPEEAFRCRADCGEPVDTQVHLDLDDTHKIALEACISDLVLDRSRADGVQQQLRGFPSEIHQEVRHHRPDKKYPFRVRGEVCDRRMTGTRGLAGCADSRGGGHGDTRRIQSVIRMLDSRPDRPPAVADLGSYPDGDRAGVAWILDGLEITVASAVADTLTQPETLGLSSAAVGLIASRNGRGGRRAVLRAPVGQTRPTQPFHDHLGCVPGGQRSHRVHTGQ